MPTSHILRCSHSPVKVLNQWEKEIPSNRIELVWAGSQFHMRLTLSKRKIKCRHKIQHPRLFHFTGHHQDYRFFAASPSSNTACTRRATSFLTGLFTFHFGSSPHLNISTQYASVLLLDIRNKNMQGGYRNFERQIVQAEPQGNSGN